MMKSLWARIPAEALTLRGDGASEKENPPFFGACNWQVNATAKLVPPQTGGTPGRTDNQLGVRQAKEATGQLRVSGGCVANGA